MALKDVNEERTSDGRIAGVFQNPRMYGSLGEHAHTHRRRPKRGQMWTFFVIGFAAGIIGFILLSFR